MKTSPRQFFFLITAVFFLTSALMITLSLQMPRLGVEFDRAQAAEAPLRVLSVDPHGPSNGRLKAGDVIRGYIESDGDQVPLHSGLLLTYPGTLLTYSDYNHYIRDLDRLFNAPVNGVLQLLLEDGQRVDVPVLKARDIHQMPGWWFFRIFRTALVVFLVTGPLAFQRKSPAVRSFALAGMGSAATGFALLPLEGRELMISGWLMHHLYLSIWASELVYGGALLALLWGCPVRLPGYRLVWTIVPVFLVLWIAHVLQLGASMADMQAIPGMLAFGFGVLLVTAQWKATLPGTPQRRTVVWFMVFISGGIAWFVALLIVPLLFHRPALADVQLITLSSLFIFVGLSFGIYRDRLFNVDPWMISAWLLFAAAIMTWVIDFLLVWMLDLDSTMSMTASAVIVVVVYLPVRHWLWVSLAVRNRQSDYRLLLRLIDVAMRYDPSSTSVQRWRSWLQEAFHPLHVEQIPSSEIAAGSVRIREGGVALDVGAHQELPALRLRYADVGDRFFTVHDAWLCGLMIRWFVRARTLQESRQQGEHAERARMMRDLHDDVVPPLLSLIYQTQGSPLHPRIRGLMQSLREIILSLDQRNSHPKEAPAQVQK